MNSIAEMTDLQVGSLPHILDFEWLEARKGFVRGQFAIAPKHLSPHGFLHGATIVALADSACGFGCLASLPDDSMSFATGELKTNFIGTARTGLVVCEARLVHSGRTTQVWDAEVVSVESNKAIALFRCTQMLLNLPPDRHSARRGGEN